MRAQEDGAPQPSLWLTWPELSFQIRCRQGPGLGRWDRPPQGEVRAGSALSKGMRLVLPRWSVDRPPGEAAGSSAAVPWNSSL